MTGDRRTIDAIANLIDIADKASERSVTERVRAEKAEAELAAIRELVDGHASDLARRIREVMGIS